MEPELAELLGLDPADADLDALEAASARDMDLIEQLVEVRRSTGLTQREVADRMGRSQPNVSAFERVGGDPHLSTIRRYAAAVGAQVHWRIAIDGGRTRIPFATTAVDSDASQFYRRVL